MGKSNFAQLEAKFNLDAHISRQISIAKLEELKVYENEV